MPANGSAKDDRRNKMKKNIKALAIAAVLALAACAAWLALRAPRPEGGDNQRGDGPAAKGRIAEVRPSGANRPKSAAESAERPGGDPEKAEAQEGENGDEPEELSEEDRREREAEARVNAFDDMTDKFMETEEGCKAVTMDDVKKFRELFKKVPKERKEECLHRALNLLPDDNVMLLAGILMDKEEDKELVELVFNDILNRDESVKQVLLKEIIKDKTHPCWADTAWILDVTGKGKE